MPLAPPAAAPDLFSLTAKLRQRASNHLWMALGQLALGLAATFLLPMLLLGFVPIPWRWFWRALIIVIGLMYITEWRMNGEYFLGQARYPHIWWNPPGRYYYRSWTDAGFAALPVIWEILFFGPRLVFESLTWFRCVWIVRSADLSRAAEILKTLLAKPDAIPVRELQKNGEPPLVFGCAMAHLLVHEWIGSGEAQDGQVWLTSESREALRAA